MSLAHEEAWVATRQNRLLAGWSGNGSAPEGAIAVYASFQDEEGIALRSLYAMRKLGEGDDPARGDWIWETFPTDGSAARPDTDASCSGCHAHAAHDYVFRDPPSAG